MRAEEMPDHPLRAIARGRGSDLARRDDSEPRRGGVLARHAQHEKMRYARLPTGGTFLNTIEVGAREQPLRPGEAQDAYFL